MIFLSENRLVFTNEESLVFAYAMVTKELPTIGDISFPN
jgi:hypothetical protein